MELDHINLKTDRLDETVAFYRDLVGLDVGYRPNFPYPGAWLYHAGRPIVHLKSPGGRDADPDDTIDHVAFRTADLTPILSRLREAGVPHVARTLPDNSARQVFVTDPNGVKVEITGK
jgi:catechol 2,3-dioxygenase-like lactoylglutathione lyase family enzyme